MQQFAPVTVCLIGLAACGSGSGGPDRPATITLPEVQAIRAEIPDIHALPTTVVGDLPIGAVTYEGQFVARLTDAEIRGNIAGDLNVTVDFVGDAANGALQNMNITSESDEPIERVDGEILVSGTETDGSILMTGQGELSFTGSDGVVGTSLVPDVTVTGIVKTDAAPGDTIAFFISSQEAVGDLEFEFSGGQPSDGRGGFADRVSP
ncbi:hypothetical protein [Yoonia sp. SS1-5]|uniref:Uncharacterized protein n=1 Tax=Yoonia rhodophyticola TaxID=3137370 RepID=A0AAN0MAB9_9RHOB